MKQGVTLESESHVVCLYRHDSDLAEAVAAYLKRGLSDGASLVLVAVPEHLREIEDDLRAHGEWEPERISVLDAAETLESITSDGWVEADAFDRVVGGAIRSAAAGGRPVRAYGEMVSLLWQAGDVLATFEVEALWDDLGRQVPFSLLCSYPSEPDQTASGPDSVAALHDVVHTVGARVRETTASFEAVVESPCRARHLVVSTLADWGHGATVIDDASLVVTELASNAVVHVCRNYTVTLKEQPGRLLIGVTDPSVEVPTPSGAPVSPRSGRGLRLVSALAKRWWVELTPDGKTVWAEVPSES